MNPFDSFILSIISFKPSSILHLWILAHLPHARQDFILFPRKYTVSVLTHAFHLPFAHLESTQVSPYGGLNI